MLSRETDTDSYKSTRLDYHATVRELPSGERPRERLQHFGPRRSRRPSCWPSSLRTGTRGDNALELANKLLSKYVASPDWCAPISVSCAPSTAWSGEVGPGQGGPGDRAQAWPDADDARYKIRTPADAANLVMLDLAYLDTEQTRILLLDAKSQLVEKASSTRARPTARSCAPRRSSARPSSATALASSSAQPPQRRPGAVTGGYPDDLAAGGGRAHPRHRAGRPHHHRPPALRQPEEHLRWE